MQKFITFSLFLISFSFSKPLVAMEIIKKGDAALLQGGIKSGDEIKFKEFINDPTNSNIKVIKLNSSGGFVIPARDIGRLIRSKNLSTFVDGKTDNCASACTVIFGSGIKRHYVNGNSIKDGVYGFKEITVGLGYHEGNSPLSKDGNRYSGQATADMIASYYEFGVKNAKDIITLAPPNKLYRISSQTALNLGISTSSSNP